MVTSGMAPFGRVTIVWGVAQFNMAVSTTEGFSQYHCSGEINSANNVGFWCDWDAGDGAVMMIGGGGKKCNRADHGIGVTEANAASFKETVHGEKDFANNVNSPSTSSYSLNLWVR